MNIPAESLRITKNIFIFITIFLAYVFFLLIGCKKPERSFSIINNSIHIDSFVGTYIGCLYETKTLALNFNVSYDTICSDSFIINLYRDSSFYCLMSFNNPIGLITNNVDGLSFTYNDLNKYTFPFTGAYIGDTTFVHVFPKNDSVFYKWEYFNWGAIGGDAAIIQIFTGKK